MSSIGVECDNNAPRKKPVVFTRRSRQKVKEPKLKPPSALERVFGKPNKPRDRYFTTGVKINESNNIGIKTEVLPFSYPKDLEEFSYRLTSKSWRQSRIRQENERKYNERHKVDLLNRLFVTEPEVKSMKTILDIDPQFFTLTAGRPVGRKFNRRDYIEDVNNVLRTKIAIGYREDDIMVVDENYTSEKKIHDEVSREFQKYLNAFEEFLFNDHSASMALLKESEQIESEASEKVETLQKLTKGFISLKSTVCNLEEKWRNCKTYQKFLYLVSPMDWRKEHDFYLTQETANDRRPAGEVQSLSNLISQFVEDVQTQENPSLFFTEPNQLLKVFAFIELQNLNTLLHSEELAVPLEQVKEAVKFIEDSFSNEVASLQEMIDNLEREIIWEEDRAKRLEELALELINGDLKELISNEEAINLYVFVEDVYEDRLGAPDSNMTLKEMMKIIETGYRDYLLHLDRLPEDLVRKAEWTCRRNERKKMLLAENAAKKVVQVERLTKHLARLLDPPMIRTARSLKCRSPRVEDVEKPQPPRRPMTADQIDHLEFFTDSCFHSDDPKLFGVRVHKNDAH